MNVVADDAGTKGFPFSKMNKSSSILFVYIDRVLRSGANVTQTCIIRSQSTLPNFAPICFSSVIHSKVSGFYSVLF